jgi:hypothetical protein
LFLKGREQNALPSLPPRTADNGQSARSEPDGGGDVSGDKLLTRARAK